ncbi:hypothetical protein GGX14DRAFT_572921 [Mycena pura]|uniref:Uncharacterized protein n=1 Tax=Mycena pura TaxID=153505 RepID=A0AAD6V4A6_9AGAR|nr:hypothetical protein GGX14DRAFT_572921 [Mycena pura]
MSWSSSSVSFSSSSSFLCSGAGRISLRPLGIAIDGRLALPPIAYITHRRLATALCAARVAASSRLLRAFSFRSRFLAPPALPLFVFLGPLPYDSAVVALLKADLDF